MKDLIFPLNATEKDGIAFDHGILIMELLVLPSHSIVDE
jgi:hypothetical protein